MALGSPVLSAGVLLAGVSLCASFLLLAGCDRRVEEANTKPVAPAVTEPAAAPPQAAAAPEAMQTAVPESDPVVEHPGKPLRVGGSVTWPEVIHRVTPDFAALPNGEVRAGGAFLAEAVVDEKGNVTSARTLRSSSPKYDAAALAALRQWKFKPATFNGKPVAVYYTLTVNIHWQ